jgi:photosynthetic reaction center H subunit
METGSVIGNIDLAQLVLYTFWIFFACLIYYLRQEDRREGYPLIDEATGQGGTPNFFFVPKAKTFDLPHGGTATAPNGKVDAREIKLRKQEVWAGAPYVPTGDPMVDGVGPAAWAERADTPDLTADGEPKIVPLRSAKGFALTDAREDPTGYAVVAGDGKSVGTVSDLWVDKAESLVRYVEVQLAGDERKVLVPKAMANIKAGSFGRAQGRVMVPSIHSHQFAGVPKTARATQITLLEEDKIGAYFAGGTLYADPDRAEPFL